MIKKIISIKNYSKFHNLNISKSDWDGSLQKVNLIYAPNGSGKTSLSVLFRSLRGDNSLVSKKKEFGSVQNPEILFIGQDGKEIKFSKQHWNKQLPTIEVFDSFYTEDNIYIITIEDKDEKLNLFELALGDEIVLIKKQIIDIKKQIIKTNRQRRNLRYTIKKAGDTPEKRKKLQELLLRRQELEDDIKRLEENRFQRTQKQREIFLDKINKYLNMFSDDIKITQLNQKRHLIIYGIQIGGHQLRTDDENFFSLKYSLSEGDKNALALSFFLAKLDMIPNKEDYLIIIDDPFTSFDVHRKLTTIRHLIKLCNNVKQIIILTHDINFANDFTTLCDLPILNLTIRRTHEGNQLFLHDIKSETLTGIFKDLNVLNNFLLDGVKDESHLREVVRCIRPSIEGIFRVKYFKYIRESQWLGDFISLIRESDENSPFCRLKAFIEDISEINDYSKIYHHSNPTHLEVPINPKELEIYVRKTILLIENI